MPVPASESKSLLSQLENLKILSSDEEDATVEEVEVEEEECYISPTKSIASDEAFVNDVLKTPGASKIASNINNTNIDSTKSEASEITESCKPPQPPQPIAAEIKPTIQLTVPESKPKKMQPIPYRGVTRLPPAPARAPIKGNHYVSMAEAITKFQKNTPDRFRTLPRGVNPLKRSKSCEIKAPTAQRESKSPVAHATGTATTTNSTDRSRANSVSKSVRAST